MLTFPNPAVVAPASEQSSTDVHPGVLPRIPVSRNIALLLALFAGFFGAHNFYLGNALRGSIQLGLCLLAYATVDTGVGIIVAVVLGLWVLAEFLFIIGLIPPSNCDVPEA